MNKDYIVINKWNGIATQGGTKIINSIDSIIKNINNNMNLVHRLDIGTTGSLIISKNYLTSRFFGQQFKEKKIKKVYLALCIGKPIKNKGTINLKSIFCSLFAKLKFKFLYASFSIRRQK